MEKFENLEDEINSTIKCINDFNNGNAELVYDVEAILKRIKIYSDKITSNYVSFLLIELRLNLHFWLKNDSIRRSDAYQSLIQYYKEDLSLYLEASKILKRYIRKCEMTGDVDKLDSAYLMTIFLSYILTNLRDYVQEIANITSSFMGYISYIRGRDIREKTKSEMDDLKILMKNLEEEI